MRVLLLTNLWPDAERPWHGVFVRAQAESLRAAGVEIDVMPIRGYASDLEYLKAGVRALGLNRGPRYDVVHAHYGHSGVVGRLQLRAPLVISYHGSDLLGKPTPTGPPTMRSRVDVAVFRQFARTAAATITMSRRMEAVLPRACLPRNRIIPTGVDLERFARGSQQEARRRLGWAPDEKAVLWVGNLHRPLKNFVLAEHTVQRLAEDVPRARLRVAWEVRPEDIPTWLTAADALLLTSRSEGSPTVVKEAMAAELPVVSTDVGDVSERIEGVPACAVVPGEPGELADALKVALDHGPVAEAREAIAPLSEAATARRIVELYAEVTRSRSGRADPFAS